MTRFRLNARAFGGLGLFFMILIIIIPLYIVLFNSGFAGNLPSNVIQQEEGVRHDLPSKQNIALLVALMIISFLFILYIRRVKRLRQS